MIFTCKTTFKSGYTTYEEGNKHDSEACGIEYAEVVALHKAGFISIEGQDDNEMDKNNVVLVVDNVKIGNQTDTAGV